ncbi:uncharacterized protein (UPF0216 family) [Methanohalophilus levihalophilus]|uniref:DUF61 family protein n=1 Tax=Methanohalophilus levihalophilus TaxID=1431282 RepID=UPI001AE53FE1|nr:DUF61 family protein [Methanohalophilus levihalophilus]MBP2030693.1 uncharacterized protein (UPF0216 family) [Methanohalophilus levihalophilus]
MTGRAPGEDSVFTRWVRGEISKINRGIVADRKTLATLLKEEKPSSKTKDGDDYVFDTKIIKALGDKLPWEVRERLKLPILFFTDIKVDDSCFLNDKTALKAFQILGELGEKREFHDGKVWVGKSIAYSILKKYPTVVQIAMR